VNIVVIILGKIKKGMKCTVIGCENMAVRSVSMGEVGLVELKVEEGRRAYLCGGHYKEFKKKNKGARLVDKWRWRA
jgi:hypothetical protein